MYDLSLSHPRFNCTYHIVFIPKFRRKVMYGEVRQSVVEILRKLCEMCGVTLLSGSVGKDHVHMYVSIPPKKAVSEFMGYLKGKSTLMLFDRHPQFRKGDRHFCARGYYVAPVGNVNEETIKAYIREQEESDKLEGSNR